MDGTLANPYTRAWGRRRAHRRREQGLLDAAAWLLPLLVLAGAGPVVEPVFMGFLAYPDALAMGTAGLGLRLGLVACGAMSIWTYGALVRGEERPILDPHPARPDALLRYLLLRLALEKAWMPVSFALLLLPMLVAGEALAWGLAAAVGLGGWAVGLLIGFTVHLGSVWAAESEALSGVLNLIRGTTPKLQAALIYAPGVALAVGGAAVWAASEGARLVLSGHPEGAALLLAPVVVGALGWLPAPRLGARYHFRATIVLAEIDGAYAGQEDPEEARRVYLEWAVRLLPEGLRQLALRELRHGWRGLRTWITGAWGLGLLAFLSAWSVSPEAGPRASLIAGASIVFIGIIANRLAATDPLWLEQVLPSAGPKALAARAFAVLGWLQGVLLLPALGLLIRQGAPEALAMLLPAELLALVVTGLGVGLSPWRARALPVYLLLAGLAWGAFALLGPASLSFPGGA